jgi:enoyl-CoA hydratase/carnithine racemase
MTTTASPVRVRQHSPAYWRVTFDNPPVNLHNAEVVAGLRDLVDRLESDPGVQVVVFDSANPDFFMAHIDLVRRGEVSDKPGPTGLPPWPDILTRLEHAPYITVGSVRGRARGVGSEFLLALDIRFASREKAIFCQPEIGFGFFPGGGGLERLPLVTGRPRAMEVILGGEDFDADTAERYGWINRSVPDAELDAFTDRFATRVAGFDRLATKTAKEILNTRSHVAAGSDQAATNARFLEAFARPEVKARIQRFMEKGGQQNDDLELNLGERLPGL